MHFGEQGIRGKKMCENLSEIVLNQIKKMGIFGVKLLPIPYSLLLPL